MRGLLRHSLWAPDGVNYVGNAVVISHEIKVAEDSRLLLCHCDVSVRDDPGPRWRFRRSREIIPLCVRGGVFHIVDPHYIGLCDVVEYNFWSEVNADRSAIKWDSSAPG